MAIHSRIGKGIPVGLPAFNGGLRHAAQEYPYFSATATVSSLMMVTSSSEKPD